MITVYHGGTQTVERPVCMFGRENLDFGRGFYVTPLLKQASDWNRPPTGLPLLPNAGTAVLSSTSTV